MRSRRCSISLSKNNTTRFTAEDLSLYRLGTFDMKMWQQKLNVCVSASVSPSGLCWVGRRDAALATLWLVGREREGRGLRGRIEHTKYVPRTTLAHDAALVAILAGERTGARQRHFNGVNSDAVSVVDARMSPAPSVDAPAE